MCMIMSIPGVTVLATTHVASGHAELTLMHEQAVDVPGHPSAEPTHVTYNWKVYTSDYRTKWMVSRLVVDACGMRRGDVSRDLSRSGLRRECGLAARHLVRVVVVTDIVHISSDLANERRLTFVISYNKSCELLEGKLGPSIL